MNRSRRPTMSPFPLTSPTPSSSRSSSPSLTSCSTGGGKSSINPPRSTSLIFPKSPTSSISSRHSSWLASGSMKTGVNLFASAFDEKVAMEEKVVLSNQQAEDVGWDEIGDVGSGDEKKTSTASRGGSTSRDDLRKRLAVEDDDEDLNWDIEDDDEPVKA